MPGAARRSVDVARGAQIGGNQSYVYVEGHLWMVLGDINAPHGIPPHVPGPDRMVTASRFVFINGIPVCRQGDLAGCGHPTTGSSAVFVTDGGVGKPDPDPGTEAQKLAWGGNEMAWGNSTMSWGAA